MAFAGTHGRCPHFNEKSRQHILNIFEWSANNMEKARRRVGVSTGSSTRDSGEGTDPAAGIPGLLIKQRWIVVIWYCSRDAPNKREIWCERFV